MNRADARGLVPGLAVALLLPLCGCMSAVKQAYYEVKGAEGDVRLLNDVAPEALRTFGTVQFTPVTTALPPRYCPPTVLEEYDRCARQGVTALKPQYPGEGPTLTIDSEVLYGQGKGLLSAGLLITRLRMRDERGNLVVDALLRSESKSFREGRGEHLAASSIQALTKWLRAQKEPPQGEPEPPTKNDAQAG